ncbi:MAG: site-specific integrase [Treponema sp.]|jgi:site-specific recombinase XerD|nr:site-specific integrase [Treponema sp.]
MKKKQGEKDMNQIAQRITGTPAGSPQEMAMRIKREAPTLADLNNEQLEQIARLVMTQRLTAELNKQVNLAGINYTAEKKTFLNSAGKTKSEHTRRAYSAGLERLEKWTAAQGINILELTPAQADDFIYALNGNRSAASIRLDTAAASSFYTWLHRRHNAIDNPFRGTKARPVKKAVKKIEVPTAAELKTIIKELPKYESAAVSVMAYRGLRAGALATMSINGGRFTAYSKGKDITGELPTSALAAIKKAGLPLRGAFSGISSNTLEKKIARSIARLHQAGKINAAYSAHDLRHFYAITEYKTDRDIHRVSKLLGHASIQVTELYLRGLGELDWF